MSPNPQETADLVTFPEEFLNGKLHFLCSAQDISSCSLCISSTKEKKSRKWKAIIRSLVQPIFTEDEKQLAEWEKLVKEVNNTDREYIVTYLWMGLEWFEDLFSLVVPLIT